MTSQKQNIWLLLMPRCRTAAGKGELPLRLLDNWSLSAGRRGSQLVGLEALESRRSAGASFTLRGALQPPTERGAKRSGGATVPFL